MAKEHGSELPAWPWAGSRGCGANRERSPPQPGRRARAAQSRDRTPYGRTCRAFNPFPRGFLLPVTGLHPAHPILGWCTPPPGRLLGPPVRTPQWAGAAGASLQLRPPGHAGLVSVSAVLAPPPPPPLPPEGDRPIPTSTEQASFLNPHHSREAGTVLSGGGNCPGSMRPQATRAWCSQSQPVGSDHLGVTGVPEPLSPEDPAATSSSVLTLSSCCCRDRPILRLRHLHRSLLCASPSHRLPVPPGARGGLVHPPGTPGSQYLRSRHPALALIKCWLSTPPGLGRG